MNAFDAENEMNRRRAEAKRAGDAYMQLADFHRPRRRFFLGAWLAALGRRLQPGDDGQWPTVLTPRQKADQSSG